MFGYYSGYFNNWQEFKEQTRKIQTLLKNYKDNFTGVDITNKALADGIIYILQLLSQYIGPLLPDMNKDVPFMGFSVSPQGLNDIWKMYQGEVVQNPHESLQKLLSSGLDKLLEISIIFLNNFLPQEDGAAKGKAIKRTPTKPQKDTEEDESIKGKIKAFTVKTIPNYNADKIMNFIDEMNIPDVVIVDATIANNNNMFMGANMIMSSK